MGLSKRARNVASLTNQTTIYGIMGGHCSPQPGSCRESVGDPQQSQESADDSTEANPRSCLHAG